MSSCASKTSTTNDFVRTIGVTAGEPAGIGPDLCVMVAQRAWPFPLVVFADPGLLHERAAQLDKPLDLRIVDGLSPLDPASKGTLYVHPIVLNRPAVAGQLDPQNAQYVLATLQRAIEGCMNGELAAMATAPVNKAIINEAGITFSGHTEYLAEQTGGNRPVMMLACPGLRVALATTHLPLRDIPAAITRDGLSETLEILHHDLSTRFSIPSPRILVCGLNPHAGETGHLGREEIDIIEPVIGALRSQGLEVRGPLPADTVFTEPYLREADAVLAMYHDQGLPVLKHKGFGNAVNITLGLPIVRTSVDHGTALDIAGSGRADPGSLIAAIELAATMGG